MDYAGSLPNSFRPIRGHSSKCSNGRSLGYLSNSPNELNRNPNGSIEKVDSSTSEPRNGVQRHSNGLGSNPTSTSLVSIPPKGLGFLIQMGRVIGVNGLPTNPNE